MTALGLVTNTLMGLVGALPQLIIGMITDCLTGSPQTLATLQGSARAHADAAVFVLRAAEPARAGQVSASFWSRSCSVKGFFSFWTRWILIGVSREIEFDLRNDLLDASAGAGAGILCAESHRRFDVARDERFERSAHGAGSGNHVQRDDHRDHGAWRYFSWSSCRRA